MSLRGFKSLHIPGRNQESMMDAEISESLSRSPSFISWNSHNDVNMHNRTGNRFNNMPVSPVSPIPMDYEDSVPATSESSLNHFGDMHDFQTNQVHITPRRVGRSLIAQDPRRQSCPPTPEYQRFVDSPNKNLMRRTFHLEDQLNKAANQAGRSPSLFRLNCYDSPLPENCAKSVSKLSQESCPRDPSSNGDIRKMADLVVRDSHQLAKSTQKKNSIIKDFILSLISTVITIIKCCIISIVCVVLAVLLQHLYKVYYTNQCNYYTHMNMTSLNQVLSSQVYGQRLVTEAVVKNVGQYLANDEQDSPLVLSFYGWTGVGKNFVSGLIADHVRSNSVIKIIVPLHFPHVQEKDRYAEQLKQWIIGNVTSCSTTLFIIDEIDKASWPIEETFREVMESLNDQKLAERRAKVIVIILSNKAASLVNRFLYDVLLSGGSRDDVRIDDITNFILERTDILNLDVWLRSLSPLNQMLPFLPLEQPQVKECIIRDMKMKGRNATTEMVQNVINFLPFSPKNAPLFSVTGCRKVSSAVDLHSNDDS